MGDKDTNMLFGNCAIFIGKSEVDMKPLKVVEDSLRLNPEDAVELDRLSVREKCDFQIPMDDSLASLLGADFASEPSEEVCSLIIMGEPKINKPKNIKYPNKKRARRVWKKWKRRFGTTPNKAMYFPEVEIECKYDRDSMSVNVKPIQNDNGNN